MRGYIYLIILFFLLGCNLDNGKNIKPEKNTPIVTKPKPRIVSEEEKEVQKKVSKYFNNFLKKRRFNGFITVSYDNQIVFDSISGFKSIRSKNKLDSNSSIQLASVSKPITALVALQLIEEGKLNLNDSLWKFFPELEHEYNRITIFQMLSHRSGLGQYHYFCHHLVDDKEHALNNDTLICIMGFHEPESYFRAGKKHNYCNTNYALLANVIAKIEGESFSNVVKRRIFDPIGMEDSFVIEMDDSLPSNLVLGNTKYNKPFDLDYLDGIVGDKGIYSNSRDLMKLDKALNLGLIICDSLKTLAFKQHNRIKRNGTSYGLGWRLKFHPILGKIVYHTGWWHGNRHILIKIPSRKVTFIVLSNAMRGSVYNLNEIAETVL